MRVFLLAQWLSLANPSASAAHDVAPGESLWRIAEEHGCSVAQLRAVNPTLAEPLQAGVRLRLPPAKSAPKSVSRPLAAPKPAVVRVHDVVAGDTLGAIARRHGTTIAALQRLNGLSDTVIVVGRRLALEAPEVPVPGRVPVADTERSPDLKALPAPPPKRLDLPAPPRDVPDDDRESKAKPPSALVGAVQLPRDRAYYLRHPKRAWGLPHVVESTRAAVIAVKKKHPGVHRLAIGDLSAERGGRLSGHKSHRNGRDVDVGLYFRRSPSSYPQRFVGASAAPLDYAATWALIEAFHGQSKRAGGPVQIFLDFEVQGDIYEWARKHGVSRRVLREVFQFPHGRWAHRGLVRHEPAHDDHLHVRFGCPRGASGCGR